MTIEAITVSCSVVVEKEGMIQLLKSASTTFFLDHGTDLARKPGPVDGEGCAIVVDDLQFLLSLMRNKEPRSSSASALMYALS